MPDLTPWPCNDARPGPLAHLTPFALLAKHSSVIAEPVQAPRAGGWTVDQACPLRTEFNVAMSAQDVDFAVDQAALENGRFRKVH